MESRTKLKSELKNYQNAKNVWKFLNNNDKKQIMLNIIKYYDTENSNNDISRDSYPDRGNLGKSVLSAY